MATIRIRKDEAGDASGHDDGTGRPWSFDWPEAGAVVEVPYAVAVELLRNPEWGFTEAEGPEVEEPAAEADDAAKVEEPSPTQERFSESPAPRKTAAKPAKKAAAPEAAPTKG